MDKAKPAFSIDFLDHVAIRVDDMERSVEWYERVLGLKRYTFEAWGPFPVFLLAGKTGVAIFPAKGNEQEMKPSVRIDHFAFQVDQENFRKAQKYFDRLGVPFDFQDHTYFQLFT